MGRSPKRNPSSRPKVALGMSGGVDSSVCAHLLVKQGYEVSGVYMECWRAPGCRTDQDRKDALKVALDLKIPFKVLDFKNVYQDKVVDLFFKEYEAGRTPNPDVLCNREIKFGLFYNWAMTQGFDYVATGHYAKIGKSGANHQLVIPRDTHKDQTYFLYPISSKQLEHTLFPLQDLTKKQVRAQAETLKLHNAFKKDSVGICFIGDINVHDFLKDRLGENPGEVVNKDGQVIGQHTGLWFYTIGQRHGFTIDKKTVYILDSGERITRENIPPFYVIAKKPDTNQLVVGFGKDALVNSFEIKQIDWINTDQQPEPDTKNLYVRIRHTGKLEPVNSFIKTDTGYQITTQTALAGVAVGQSAVFYLKQETENNLSVCLGGGVIEATTQFKLYH
jgi:tRNA-uridine 2-sulfurtransferase